MSSPDLHRRGMLLALVGMLCISPDALLLRLVSADDWQMIFWRSLFNFSALAVVVTVMLPGGLVGATRRGGVAGLLSAGLIAIAGLLFVGSITRTAVANTLVLVNVMPLFAAILGWAILGERVRWRTWMAIAAALSGILLIFSGSLGGVSLTGDLMALVAAFLLALNLIIIRRHPEVSVLAALALGGLLATVVSAFFARPFAVSPADIGLLGLTGVLVLSIGLAIFFRGARYLPAAEAGLFALIETILGPLWAWLGVGEVPSKEAFIGGAIVISALALHSVLALRRRREGVASPGVDR